MLLAATPLRHVFGGIAHSIVKVSEKAGAFDAWLVIVVGLFLKEVRFVLIASSELDCIAAILNVHEVFQT